MERRKFIKSMALTTLGLSVAFLFKGCISSVSEKAKNKDEGEPYKCTLCGYLTRSKKDITNERCPRCHTKNFKKISEEEMKKELGE